MLPSQPIVFSGIQPSGQLTLGNYLGALKNWGRLQRHSTALFCVVDQHALTSRPNSAALRSASLDTLALYLACGLDPERSILFLQSWVPEHTELNWYLNQFIYVGTLNRMTQFKEKSARQPENVNAGLLNYPCLMAADILLYQTHQVPVGDDQTQHIELTREVAARINNHFQRPLFTIPERYTEEIGARIMSLTDPTKKMSKTDPDPNSCIELLESPESIRKKLRSAKTDSEAHIRFDVENKPGISNLLMILAGLSERALAEVEKDCAGMGYAEFKQRVAEAILNTLEPIQARYRALRSNPEDLLSILKLGREKARAMAQKTLREVKDAMGLMAD